MQHDSCDRASLTHSSSLVYESTASGLGWWAGWLLTGTAGGSSCDGSSAFSSTKLLGETPVLSHFWDRWYQDGSAHVWICWSSVSAAEAKQLSMQVWIQMPSDCCGARGHQFGDSYISKTGCPGVCLSEMAEPHRFIHYIFSAML